MPVTLPKGECILTGVAISILSFVYATDSNVFRDNYRKAIGLLMKDIWSNALYSILLIIAFVN